MAWAGVWACGRAGMCGIARPWQTAAASLLLLAACFLLGLRCRLALPGGMHAKHGHALAPCNSCRLLAHRLGVGSLCITAAAALPATGWHCSPSIVTPARPLRSSTLCAQRAPVTPCLPRRLSVCLFARLRVWRRDECAARAFGLASRRLFSVTAGKDKEQGLLACTARIGSAAGGAALLGRCSRAAAEAITPAKCVTGSRSTPVCGPALSPTQ